MCNGRVFGFVHGFRAKKLREKVEDVTLIKELPDGVGKKYIENLNAVYSLAIKLEERTDHLEEHKITL